MAGSRPYHKGPSRALSEKSVRESPPPSLVVCSRDHGSHTTSPTRVGILKVVKVGELLRFDGGRVVLRYNFLSGSRAIFPAMLLVLILFCCNLYSLFIAVALQRVRLRPDGRLQVPVQRRRSYCTPRGPVIFPMKLPTATDVVVTTEGRLLSAVAKTHSAPLGKLPGLTSQLLLFSSTEGRVYCSEDSFSAAGEHAVATESSDFSSSLKDHGSGYTTSPKATIASGFGDQGSGAPFSLAVGYPSHGGRSRRVRSPHRQAQAQPLERWP